MNKVGGLDYSISNITDMAIYRIKTSNTNVPKKLKEIKLLKYRLCVEFIDIIDGNLFKVKSCLNAQHILQYLLWQPGYWSFIDSKFIMSGFEGQDKFLIKVRK